MTHADPRCVLTGTHFINGDAACCEGALAAGARFAAGYPITPSTEVVERFASRAPSVGGLFIHQNLRHHPDDLAAGGKGGVGQGAHQPEVAAAVDDADAALSEHRTEMNGRLLVHGARA